MTTNTFVPDKPSHFDADVQDDDNQSADVVVTAQPYDEPLSSNLWLRDAAHPATKVVGVLLILAGLLALCTLIPPLAPILALAGIVMASQVAIPLVIAGGLAFLAAITHIMFNKKTYVPQFSLEKQTLDPYGLAEQNDRDMQDELKVNFIKAAMASDAQVNKDTPNSDKNSPLSQLSILKPRFSHHPLTDGSEPEKGSDDHNAFSA